MNANINKPMTQQLFAHFDIEADGPTPMTSNMINLGIVFTDSTGKVIDELVVDIEKREGFFGDKSTLDWWKSDQNRLKEYTRICANGIHHLKAMEMIENKLKKLMNDFKVSKVVWVARPASYDWMFLKCYFDLYRVTVMNPIDIGFSARCCSTFRDTWMILKGYDNKKATEVINGWAKDLVMTHNGLDDARYQAVMFHGILNDVNELSKMLTNKL